MPYFRVKNLLVYVQAEDNKRLTVTGVAIPGRGGVDPTIAQNCTCTCTCTGTGGDGGCTCSCTCTCTGTSGMGDLGLERINPADLAVLQEALKEGIRELEQMEKQRG